MAKKLKVTIGGHRDDAQVAYVNDSSRPTEIDTDLFVGRVSVFVRDFAGISPDGQARRDHPYFHGRSRAFGILIEGRFKHTYNGYEIQFGTDFDYLPEVSSADGLLARFHPDIRLDSRFRELRST